MRQSCLLRWPEAPFPIMSATSVTLPSDNVQANHVQVRVIVPARDEEQTIEYALDALRGQVDLSGRPLDTGCFDVTVLANNCVDETAKVSRAYADRHSSFPLRVLEHDFPLDRANIGTARRTLVDDACARFEDEGRAGIVASTDADTLVAPDWIAATLDEFARGAEAVGGRILLSADELSSLPPELRRVHLQDTGYRIMLAKLGAKVDPNPFDPSPCHHQHFGASLAVRSDIYRRAGGIPDVTTLEDMAFYDALERIDAQVRHSPHVRVTTSARRQARVPIGLSTQLEEWAVATRTGRPVLVEPVTRSLKRLHLRRELRGRWRYRRSHGELMRGARMDAFAFFGAFLADVRAEIERYLDETVGNEPVPVTAAIDELRMALATRR